MRSLMCHEKKLVELLMECNTRHAHQIPQSVVYDSIGPDAAAYKPLLINETFTLYFQPDSDDQQLKLLSSDLAMPLTIGNELFLVEDTASHQLAFLEYMGPTALNPELVQPHLCKVAQRISHEFPAIETFLLDDMLAWLSCMRNRILQLGYARILIVDNVLCFFLSAGDRCNSIDQSRTAIYESDDLQVCQLQCEGSIALDGWYRLRGC